MAIYSRDNLYQGVNAHLHSALQSPSGGWEVFHASHIIHVARMIDTALPATYIVQPERSLQIREYHADTGEMFSEYQVRRLQSAAEALEEESAMYLTALAIRELTAEGKIGQSVTWIELLSPANKSGGAGFGQYREKRAATLRGGIALIEIDYLHETRSPVNGIPSYPDDHVGAYAYSVIVTNPRPTLQEGQMKVYGFGVDAALPVIEVPLAGQDWIALALGPIYNQTYSSLSAFSRRVDYEQLPARFKTYSADDQTRIRQRMATIQQTEQK